MDEIEYIYQNYHTFNVKEQFDRVDELLNQDYGVRVSKKEENGFVDIQYNNRMGEYKAKLLIEYFNQNKEFWQYFLQRKSKIVIGKVDNFKDDELFIENGPFVLHTPTFLERLLNDKEKRYSFNIYRKIDDKEYMALPLEKCISLIKKGLLKNMLDGKNIDFFEYLDLNDGAFVNLDYYYEMACIDVAFELGNFEILDAYMNLEEAQAKSVFQNELLFTIYQKYSILLFRELLEGQVKLLKQFSKEKNDDFLEGNIHNLGAFFQNELFRVFRNFNIGGETNKEKLKLSRNEIINLVVEFLSKIDETGTLRNEFITNVDNGKIVLWDQTVAEERIKMATEIKRFGSNQIDEPACLYIYDDNGYLTDIMVNVPLTYTLEDVWTIIHEYFHFHSNINGCKIFCNRLVTETPSIYFEKLARDFLIGKGYDIKDINVNFRIVDSLSNISLVLPIINYISNFMQNGFISIDMIDEMIRNGKNTIILDGVEKGLSQEDINNELKRQGLFGDIVEIRKNILLNMTCLLLRQKRSIFTLTPYLLGTIITNNAIENNLPIEDMINLSTGLNNVTDILDIMKMVGIDTNKYGLTSSNGVSK